jgi:hypothetical protein
MSVSKVYDSRAVVLAYVDAQRPPYPHEDFRTFRRARVRALESAYGIRTSVDGASSPPLWMLFNATVQSYLGLGGPRAGFLDDSLINTTLERLDSQGQLRETEVRLHTHLEQCRELHLELLEGLFALLWGPIRDPVTVERLRELGFDEAKEPQWIDYVDDM